MNVQDLDHLGIIAGIIDQMGLEARVNECLGTHPQQKVSPGQGLKAMILNGLGFVSAPLYLYAGFFNGKATEHLLGEGIAPEHLNDDYLGRLLDKLWDYGPSALYSRIAMDAYRTFALTSGCYHYDSSSLSVHGEYDIETPERGGIEITHGYSKDHRPDLKQFMVELMCSHDGGVPLALTVSSGNQSDKAVFGERVTAFAQQWNLDGMLVADSALYSAANLAQMGDLRWITRVPLTLSEAQALVSDLPAETFEAGEQDGYRFAQVCSTYGGVKQHWVVVENSARVDSDRRQLERQVEKHRQQAETQLRRQGKIDFNCAEDARSQAQALATRWRYHTLSEVQVVEHPHYERAGRPKADETPSRITYRLTAQVVADETAIKQAKRRAGRFILATNAIDAPTLTAEQVLSDYKGQYAPERCFGLLKDPLFFTSSIFLKTPKRIAALAMVMGLAVMVYTLAQRQLRQALADADETVLDQRQRPTQRPSLRWIFQSFQAIHRVVLNGQVHISNVTPERLKVLRFLGAPCQKYYLTC